MGPSDYEGLLVELAAFQARFPLRDEDLANCLRGYVQRGDWPEWITEPNVPMQLMSKLHLRTRRVPECIALSVMLLEAMHGDDPITWTIAFSGQPGGGGLYPPSAIEHSEYEPLPEERGAEFHRREAELTARWMASRGRARYTAIEARELLGARVRAFLGEDRR